MECKHRWALPLDPLALIPLPPLANGLLPGFFVNNQTIKKLLHVCRGNNLKTDLNILPNFVDQLPLKLKWRSGKVLNAPY
jgi:hypothetical protein